ncbi:PNK3P-domain-containing protein [Atractiella rhizophila]|nr:PNK3P-domain-containing protein [Atractiella rhizophila]
MREEVQETKEDGKLVKKLKTTVTVQSTLTFASSSKTTESFDIAAPSIKFRWLRTYENDRKEASCYYGEFGTPVHSVKVASFDLDGTLIRHPGGNITPKSADDWEFLYPDVPKRLKELEEAGYEIVIFTNQCWKDDSRWSKVIGKIAKTVNAVRTLLSSRVSYQRCVEQIGVPLKVFAARRKDVFRKPESGMWKRLSKHHDHIIINKEQSFFVGDAAGRRGDHSDADKGFAKNTQLPFFTPEEFFLENKANIPKKSIEEEVGIDTTERCEENEADINVVQENA